MSDKNAAVVKKEMTKWIQKCVRRGMRAEKILEILASGGFDRLFTDAELEQLMR